MFEVNKHRFNNYIFSIILADLDNCFDFFIIIDFSIKPSRDPTSKSRDRDLGRDLRLGTTDKVPLFFFF